MVVDAAVERLGRVDILVNNAAVTTKMAPFETLDRELFEETLAVNVTAPFLATQAAARHMIGGRSGRPDHQHRFGPCARLRAGSCGL